jgi:hypothetical protein
MNLAPAHGLCLHYRGTGKQAYLDLAGQLVAEFAATGSDGRPLAGTIFAVSAMSRSIAHPSRDPAVPEGVRELVVEHCRARSAQ